MVFYLAKAFWINVEEESLVSESLLQSLQDRFNSKPLNKNNETEIKTSKVKKKIKELKVLDSKSAQNLSVILGTLVKLVTFYPYLTCSGSTLKNISYAELRKYIMHSDTSALSENLLLSLIQV